jgi:hypothetical protein
MMKLINIGKLMQQIVELEEGERAITICDPYLGDSPETSEYFWNESALAELLANDILFANSRKYVQQPWPGQPNPETPEICEETIVLFVICNDLFYWASADLEHLSLDQVKPLYEAWRKKGHFGVDEWCCLRRQMRPQTPLEKRWREEGLWTEALEALPAGDPKECG